jgi:hypothetical protein
MHTRVSSLPDRPRREKEILGRKMNFVTVGIGEASYHEYQEICMYIGRHLVQNHGFSRWLPMVRAARKTLCLGTPPWQWRIKQIERESFISPLKHIKVPGYPGMACAPGSGEQEIDRESFFSPPKYVPGYIWLAAGMNMFTQYRGTRNREGNHSNFKQRGGIPRVPGPAVAGNKKSGGKLQPEGFFSSRKNFKQRGWDA